MMKVTVLGTRGSMAVAGSEYLKYGGNTTSYAVETDTRVIILDAGTGIMHLPKTEKEITILISHGHLDHVMGIPFFHALWERGRIIHFYGATRGGLTLEQQIGRLMAPPLWPVGLEVYGAKVVYHELQSGAEFKVGDARIQAIETNHPGGCSAFRVDAQGKTVVFTGDYEHDDGAGDEALVELAHNADLLIFDGQYSKEEYARKKGFGHSTPEKGLEIQGRSHAKRLLFTHHDPMHTDEYLSSLEEKLRAGNDAVSFAREGEVITL